MAQITTGEVARRYRTSRRQIMRLIDSGDLPYVSKFPGKTGGYLFDSDQVDKAFARLEQQKHDRVAS